MSNKKKNVKGKAAGKKISHLTKTKIALFILFCGTLFLVGICIYFADFTPAPDLSPIEQPKIGISSFADVNRLVEDELLSSQGSKGWQRLDKDKNFVRLQMDGEYPESIRLMELATRIALTDSPAQLDLAPRKGLIRVLWHGELRMELLYAVKEEISMKRPVIAIIMDDMGQSTAGFKDILALGIPITPSILPYTAYARSGVSILQKQSHEYMIHLPMEPQNYPATSPGKNALLIKLNGQELKARVKTYLELVPGAIGGNNHMGSRFTQDRIAMRVVLAELKKAGFFFIDSRTIGGSVAFDEARQLGMKTGVRNIFLDNEENVSYITNQLHKMVQIAEEKGLVIAICHPYSQTFKALRQNAQWLQEQNIDFVLASKLVKRY